MYLIFVLQLYWSMSVSYICVTAVSEYECVFLRPVGEESRALPLAVYVHGMCCTTLHINVMVSCKNDGDVIFM